MSFFNPGRVFVCVMCAVFVCPRILTTKSSTSNSTLFWRARARYTGALALAHEQLGRAVYRGGACVGSGGYPGARAPKSNPVLGCGEQRIWYDSVNENAVF